MTVTTRAAIPSDSSALTEIFNGIVLAGGTTAHQTPFDTARMQRHYIEPKTLISCTVAEVNGKIAGFQSLVWPDENGQPFPAGWAVIASFVGAGFAGQGVGRALFNATLDAAIQANVKTIDATIRADNSGGLAYYNSLGFADYDILPSVPLRDGTRVDRIRKRIDFT